MITKFKDFNEGEITYDDAVSLIHYEKDIRTYFIRKYPYQKFPISSRGASKTSINKLISFSKRFKDNELLKRIERYLKERERINLKLDSEKYNL